jgi:hypothetical protein
LEGGAANLHGDEQDGATSSCARQLGGTGKSGYATGTSEAEDRETHDVPITSEFLGEDGIEAWRHDAGGRYNNKTIDIADV